jgi:hypothetical protein
MGNNAFKNNRSYPVGLAGVLPTKVTNQNGMVKRGDYITVSDLAGYGMKAQDGDTTIGVALEDQTSAQDTINILVSRNNSKTIIASNNYEQRIKNLETELVNLKAQVASLPTTTSASSTYTLPANLVKLNDLVKAQSDGSIVITAKLVADEIEVKKLKLVADMSGTIIIKKSTSSQEVTVTGITTDSKIVLTPIGQLPISLNYWIEKDADKFTLKISAPQANDISFDYVIFE